MSGRSKEFNDLMIAGWLKKKEERAQARQENKAKWAARRDWSDTSEHRSDIEVPASPEGASQDGQSRSLRRLRQIMGNPEAALTRRLEAAEIILTYELAPAAGVGVEPEAIAASSYQFLGAVSEAAGTPEALRFKALKSLAAIENARAAQKTSAQGLAARHRLANDLLNAELQRGLREQGEWAGAVSSGSWWTAASEDFSGAWPPSSIAEALR